MLWVLICTVNLTVCSYHVTYEFHSESTLYSLDYKWLNVRLRTKSLWVRITLLSLKLQIWHLLRARSSLTFRYTIECGFTLKLVREMIITYSQEVLFCKKRQNSNYDKIYLNQDSIQRVHFQKHLGMHPDWN